MKKKITALLLAGLSLTATAQTTSADSNEWLLKETRRLMSEKEYPTTLTLLSRIEYSTLDARQRQETEYIRAVATFETNSLDGRALMLQYLSDYPETAKREILSAYIAESYYYSRNFDKAYDWFKGIDLGRLEAKENERTRLHYALTAQEVGQTEIALNILGAIKATGKYYRSDAIFHIAAIDYYNERLEPAYEGFKSIEMDDKYHLEVPYYLAGIYLKRGENVRAEKLARLFLEYNSELKQGIPMRHILGAALYGQRRYSEATAPLSEYMQLCNEPQRIASYQLAMSLFNTGKYNEATPYFDSCTNDDDAITQNAYLHLGIIALKLNDIAKARLAFEQAAAMNHDSKIREEALYNYALCIHQTRYSPFAESVKVFERFLNEYPQSPHVSKVEDYLVEVYMNTRNYDTALQSIEKIEHPSADILGAKQNILYRLGVQSFIDDNMRASIEYMNRSLALSRYSRDTHSDALYWRGEAYYRLENYQAAANDYNAVLSLSQRNSGDALYGLAYTQFQQADYNQAARTFGRYLQCAPASKTSQRADAYNRIGDCHFYNRDYTQADQFYQKAAETDRAHSDYSLYRAALTQGLSKDYRAKVKTLQTLIERYPESNYAQQSLYEIGRSHVALEENREAIEAFDNLIKRYPESSLARRAAAETAIIYNQEGNLSKAIAAYKQIILKYPHSEEAQLAAQDLKSIYVEQGKIKEFTEFAASTPGMKAVESSERDTLTYAAAERIYSRQRYDDASKAFTDYLKEFPEGSFTLDSHYYLGVIYYNKKATNEALKHFEQVIAFPDNKYSEDAMALASDIHFKAGRHDKAIELYKQLAAKTDNDERRRACYMNIMRCATALDLNSDAIEAASELLNAGNLSPEWEREALHTRAKALLASNEGKKAADDLKKLASDTRSKQGAEAKYLLAQYMFDNNSYEECEQEILNYIETGTPHAYWMARSFVLLSDLYMAQGRNMEAKQYLLSLQNNYSGNDDIESLIKERLQKLSAAESETQQ